MEAGRRGLGGPAHGESGSRRSLPALLEVAAGNHLQMRHLRWCVRSQFWAADWPVIDLFSKGLRGGIEPAKMQFWPRDPRGS